MPYKRYIPYVLVSGNIVGCFKPLSWFDQGQSQMLSISKKLDQIANSGWVFLTTCMLSRKSHPYGRPRYIYICVYICIYIYICNMHVSLQFFLQRDPWCCFFDAPKSSMFFLCTVLFYAPLAHRLWGWTVGPPNETWAQSLPRLVPEKPTLDWILAVHCIIFFYIVKICPRRLYTASLVPASLSRLCPPPFHWSFRVLVPPPSPLKLRP